MSATKVPRGQEQLTQTLIMCLLKTHNKATCPPSLPEYLPQFSVLKTNFSTLLTTRRRRRRNLGPGMWTEETSATEKTTTKSRTTMRRTQTALSGKRFGLLFSLFRQCYFFDFEHLRSNSSIFLRLTLVIFPR